MPLTRAAGISLPEGVTLLSYQSTADNILAASEDEAADILSASFNEVAASASGFYVQANEDFTATYTYTADGVSMTKTLNVKVVDTKSLTRDMVEAFIDTVYVYGEEQIEVVFKFENVLGLTMEQLEAEEKAQ